jgi:arsenate reductase
MPSVARRALAEFIGTALLLLAVVGSGIAAKRLSPGDTGLELLENAVATGAALAAIIWCLGPVSGSHLNPAVSLVDSALGGLRARHLPAHLGAQLLGGVTGVVVAKLMFSLPAVTISAHVRSGDGLWLSEAVATFGLLLVIFGLVRSHRPSAVPVAVGAYITGAYFFTSSTSFANPAVAVAVARMLSNTFAGISPGSVAPFVAAELAGAAIAFLAIRVLHPAVPAAAPVVVLAGGDAQNQSAG